VHAIYAKEKFSANGGRMKNEETSTAQGRNRLRLRNLTPEQTIAIDELLTFIGDYGKINPTAQHGELRYINTVKSSKAICPSRKTNVANGQAISK